MSRRRGKLDTRNFEAGKALLWCWHSVSDSSMTDELRKACITGAATPCSSGQGKPSIIKQDSLLLNYYKIAGSKVCWDIQTAGGGRPTK